MMSMPQSVRIAIPLICFTVFVVSANGCKRDAASEIRALQQQGRFAETLEPLRELLHEKPADPELNLFYGRALLQAGQAGGAVWPLMRAREDPAYAVQAGLLLSSALLQGGSATDAIAAAARVLETDPENREAKILRARARVDAVHNEEALAELDALIEEDPDDPKLRALRIVPLIRMHRLDEAEKALGELREVVGGGEVADPVTEAHFCAAEATFLHEREEREKAQREWESCLVRYEGNATVVRGALDFYRETAQTAAARKLLEGELAREPRNVEIRIALAEMLRSAGETEESRRLMEEGAEQFPSPEGWSALADYHVNGGDYRAARIAIERAMEAMPSIPDELRFAYADILVLAGDPDAAEQIARSLELPVQRDLLQGRILLARGDPRGALEKFESGLRYWPNNAAARYLAGQAAEQLGRFDEAISQYRESVRVDAAATDAAMALVKLHGALGQPSLAIEPLRIRLLARGHDLAVWRAWVGLMFESGDPGARQSLTRLRSLDPRAAAVVAASVRRKQAGPQGAAKVIEASGLDLTQAANAEVLTALVDAHLDAGSPERALPRVDAAPATQPDAAPLHAQRGRVLTALDRDAAARAAYERALELDEGSASALVGLARLAERAGDVPVAIALYDRARDADPSDAAPAFAAAALIADRGDRAQAIDRLGAVLRVDPLHAAAALRLAELLAEEPSDLERAEDFAQRATALGGGARALEVLGRVRVARGDGDRALAALRDALKLDPDRSSLHYWLGRALALTGDDAGARAAYERAVANGTGPEVERARAELARRDTGEAR